MTAGDTPNGGASLSRTLSSSAAVGCDQGKQRADGGARGSGPWLACRGQLNRLTVTASQSLDTWESCCSNATRRAWGAESQCVVMFRVHPLPTAATTLAPACPSSLSVVCTLTPPSQPAHFPSHLYQPASPPLPTAVIPHHPALLRRRRVEHTINHFGTRDLIVASLVPIPGERC